jgi:hypothetical protein
MILSAILMLAASCTTSSDSFCLPIPTDDATPESVQLAVDDNNAAFVALCE